MKSYKQKALMSVFVVFATAYVLTIVGCGKSTDISGTPPAAPAQPENPAELDGEFDSEQPLQQIDPNDMRECTEDEFDILVDWSDALLAANKAVSSSGGRRSENIVKLSLNAIEKCDQVEFYHLQKPCKKTKRNIVDPDHPTVKAYDAFRIDQRCEPVENYLKKFNLRPNPRQNQPSEPDVDPVQPVEPTPNRPQPEPADSGEIGQCSSDEFAKLNSWRAALDTSTKNLTRLGNQSSWKYDSAAISAAKSATSLCEDLITYHQARPCKREKSYTAQSLREQCTSSRTYFYNFAQRTESLIVSNARLYLNTSIFADRAEGFRPGLGNFNYGQCVITNLSNAVITYAGQKVLVTAARVNTAAEEQMFVLETEQGLKLECYGVNYSSAATSLTEVMRLLDAKDTRLPLSYELN